MKGMTSRVKTFFEREKRLIEKIDKKAKEGRYDEEQPSYKVQILQDGSRVWSF